jgi:membrane-bound ClpP family serine protease
MFSPLVIAVILLAVGLAVIVLELFLPSGGMLGVLAVAAFVGSVIAALMHPVRAGGISFAVGEVVGIGVMLALIVRWWPESSIGRRIAPELPREEDVLPENQSLQQLVGKLGKTKSMMLPSGAVVVEGRTVNAISEGMAIEAGETVKVVEVRGNRVVVRKVEYVDTPQVAKSSDDVLSRSIEELGLEGLGESLS